MHSRSPVKRREGRSSRGDERDTKHRYTRDSRSPVSPRREYARHSREDDSRRPTREQAAHLENDPPQPGSIHRATVRNIRPFGVFVEMEGYRRHGLVHNSQISEEVSFSRDDEDEAKVKAMEFFAPVGSQVWVKVVEVRDDGSGQPKINCSMKVVSQEDGADLDPTNAAAIRGGGGGRGGGISFGGPQSDAPPEVGSVLQAMVASVKPYGIFVRLKGFRANGLVHLSQISDHLDIGKDESDEDKVNALSAVHSVGDPLWVKIVEVTDDGGERGPKVACSIKLVDQREGTDLDPHNVKWQPRGEGGPGGHGPRGPAQAAAVVQQGGTVDWGHLKAGDRQYGDAQQYDLVGDEVLAMLPPPPPPAMAAAHNGHMQQSAEPPGPSQIGSVEEAMAILAKFGKGGKSRSHKEKKSKPLKKGKEKEKKKKKKGKKHKKEKKQRSSSSDTDDS
ncbi:probable nucleolar protein of 40 kDa [Coccomyxa sp. Obi]|nr:probable nucleolar protein of 40 kDa [Coccomyxa sp. Obi]